MPRSAQQQLLSKRREAEAVRLRLAGNSYESISSELGLSGPGSAYKAFRRGVDRCGATDIQEAFAMASERYLSLLLRVWPGVTEGDQHSIDSAMQILDRLDRLYGLDHASCRLTQKGVCV